MSGTDGKTPYHGQNRCRGYFNCDSGHYWKSNWSWADCGTKCEKCVKILTGKRVVNKIDALPIPYTYPHSQEPLQETWLGCGACGYEEESRFPKPKKCRCGERMYPITYVTCPNCRYEHGWAEPLEKARKETFICKDYAEVGSGCDKRIGFELNLEEKTGPHPDFLCEKCDQLKCSCTHLKRRRNRRRSGKKPNAAEPIHTSTDESDSPGEPASRNVVKKRTRRRKKRTGQGNVDELCEAIKRL